MGLYDEDKKAVLDVIYWQTKFAVRKMEAAIKGRQPEYAIRGLIPSLVRGCENILKTYPNHKEVKEWMDTARDVEKKIDPKAARADFTAAFGEWKDASYESGWRYYHLAKMAAAAGDWTDALTYSSHAVQNLGRAVDRMSAWPPDTQAWITQADGEMQALRDDAAKKR